MNRLDAIIFIEAARLDGLLEPLELVAALRAKFCEDCEMPERHHHSIAGASAAGDGTLLLMPAWQRGRYLGIKTVTVFPGNPKIGLPTLMGFYALLSAETGELLALMDARTLTAKRTAAASALAATYLARADSARLVMIGAGALAPYIIRAHAAVRPIASVVICDIAADKAAALASSFAAAPFVVDCTDDLEAAVRCADIVSCATTATDPVVRGAWLKPGTHVDLIGAFRPWMREADDDAIVRARLYVDSRVAALHEPGDIVVPLKQGLIHEDHIIGDLFELARGKATGRRSPEEITVFKAVGMALEDLAAAELVYAKYNARPINDAGA